MKQTAHVPCRRSWATSQLANLPRMTVLRLLGKMAPVATIRNHMQSMVRSLDQQEAQKQKPIKIFKLPPDAQGQNHITTETVNQGTIATTFSVNSVLTPTVHELRDEQNSDAQLAIIKQFVLSSEGHSPEQKAKLAATLPALAAAHALRPDRHRRGHTRRRGGRHVPCNQPGGRAPKSASRQQWCPFLQGAGNGPGRAPRGPQGVTTSAPGAALPPPR